MNTTLQRAIVLSLLVLLMGATRSHYFSHFAPVPDASWAIFFIGGFYLRAWTRWAFPLLMVLAVGIDWVVITGQGIGFWEHYCMSPAYWFLIPAHLTMWLGGMWMRQHYQGASVPALGRLALSVVAATALCHLLAQGSFYWISRNVAEPTFAGWWQNYAQWFLPYLQSTATFVGVAAVAQAVSERIAKTSHVEARDAKHR
ncbi:hypothetical protein [Luteimonas panaciterrae]|uniref:hypothetical protein n=1 Tax=Luteimonas panaciterrae TaxID=363885 RepID=UPI001CF9C61E|nr:hypothetical protein [Luteimonas panaciterrae]